MKDPYKTELEEPPISLIIEIPKIIYEKMQRRFSVVDEHDNLIVAKAIKNGVFYKGENYETENDDQP